MAKGYWLMMLLLVVLTGCEKKETVEVQGNVDNPNWVVTVENDLTASMTAVVQVSFTQQEGTLAAFMGKDCCGIGEYIDGLYWLYISPASEAGGEVQLCFYSPDLKRIYEAKETFAFRNDGHLGSVAEPYTPEWTVRP